jgi:NitT/TauT family transport system substrate-binding protein
MRIASPRRVVATVILGVLPLVLVSACGSSSSSTGASSGSKLEKTNIVVGGVPTEANAALYLAESRGIFKAHGLNVKIDAVTSSAVLVPAMKSGAIDVAAGQVAALIAAQAQGQGPFRIVASGLEITPGVNELLALKSSGINNAGGLKGKTVAVNSTAGNGPLLTDAALATYNLKPTAVTYKAVPFPAMGAALATKAVDAVYCTQPYCQDMAEQQGARVVADLDQGSAQGMLITGYTVTDSWFKKYPKTAAAFTASIVEASRLADTNLAAVQQTLEKDLKIKPAVADVMATGTFPTTVDTVKLQQVEALMLRFGQLKKSVNVNALVNS